MLHDVVERCASLGHGERADCLAADEEQEGGGEEEGGDLWGESEGREERVVQDAFEGCGSVGHGVCGAVLGEEEGGDARGGGVVVRCGPELEEVEGGEGGEEEGKPPEGRGGGEEEVEC